MVVDTVEHIDEPFFGINVVMFASGEEGVDHGGSLRRFVAAYEEVVFSADGHRADDVLYQVVVNFNMPIDKKQGHILPAVESVFNGFSDGTGRGDLVVFG